MQKFSVIALGAALALGAGCGGLRVPEEPPRPSPTAPQWSPETIREHLRFFNGDEAAGRVTGTLGFANAAAYVAARMAEFELQPVVRGEFRRLYNTPLHLVQRGHLFVLSRNRSDTMAFVPGVDFLPDGHSDAGRLAFEQIVVDPGGAGPPTMLAAPAVLLPAASAEPDYLRALQAAGARVVFSVGVLTPRTATEALGGLLFVQLTPQAAGRMLGLPPASVPALFDAPAPMLRPLPQPVQLGVQAQAMPIAGALNVLGYVAGKHPAHADELVIVCADLDAVGGVAGVQTLDAAHLGVGAAAVLEVARQYAYFAQFSVVPERTILFAVFSGARQGHAGLRAYLRQPPWPLEKTRRLIYAGLDPDEMPAVAALAAEYDLPFEALAVPPDTLGLPRRLVVPDRRPPRQPTARRDGDAGRAAVPRTSAMRQAGSAQALALAQTLYDAVLAAVMTPAPLLPIDTLRVPVANEEE